MYDYQKIYETYHKLPYFARTGDTGMTALYWANAKFEPAFIDALKARYFEMFPRRKKWDPDYALRSMGEDEIDSIRAKYQARGIAMVKARLRQAQLLEQLMDALCHHVIILPRDKGYLLKVSPISAYASQGYGAKKYAKAALYFDHDVALNAGYNPVIIENIEGRQFELWANLEPWQYDALVRRTAPTLLQWAVKCWQSQVNPRVYNPFLPDDVFEKSLKDAGYS